MSEQKKYKINEDECIGCGGCEAEYPNTFRVEDGKAGIINQQNVEYIKAAAEDCPMEAIEVEGQDEQKK